MCLTRVGSARTGDEQAKRVARHVGKAGFDQAEKLQHLLGLLGVVPLVVLPENFIGDDVHHHGLDGGGTDIHPDHQALGILFGAGERLVLDARLLAISREGLRIELNHLRCLLFRGPATATAPGTARAAGRFLSGGLLIQ
jgi:hypothetical protein